MDVSGHSDAPAALLPEKFHRSHRIGAPKRERSGEEKRHFYIYKGKGKGTLSTSVNDIGLYVCILFPNFNTRDCWNPVYFMRY
jgi:hypothetical protein